MQGICWLQCGCHMLLAAVLLFMCATGTCVHTRCTSVQALLQCKDTHAYAAHTTILTHSLLPCSCIIHITNWCALPSRPMTTHSVQCCVAIGSHVPQNQPGHEPTARWAWAMHPCLPPPPPAALNTRRRGLLVPPLLQTVYAPLTTCS